MSGDGGGRSAIRCWIRICLTSFGGFLGHFGILVKVGFEAADVVFL